VHTYNKAKEYFRGIEDMRRRIVALFIAGALLVAGGVAFATEGRGAGINGGVAAIESIEWGDAEIVPMQSVISAGGSMSFVIKPDGSLWGTGGTRLGIGTSESTSSYIKIMEGVIAVSDGRGHTTAIKATGSLWAWGNNGAGQLGDGTNITRLSPIKVMDDVIAVSAGDVHTMAIRTDDSLWAWGNNDFGRLGDGTITDRYSPVKILGNVIAVSAGNMHTMAIRSDGSLWGWGSNGAGQLGDGTTIDRHSPTKIMDDVIAVSAGSVHTMAIKTDGSLWAWGSNHFNQLGDGAINIGVLGANNRHYPIMIMEDVAAVSAGARHTMAIKTDGSLWAWGNYRDGQLGNGQYTPPPPPGVLIHHSPDGPSGGAIDVIDPVRIMDGVIAVSAGFWHTIAIRADGSLWAWGNNPVGQLGDNSRDMRPFPVKVLGNVLLP